MIDVIRKSVALLDPAIRRRWLALSAMGVIAAALETSGTAIVFGVISLIGNPAKIADVPVIGGQLIWFVDRFGDRAVIAISFFAAMYFIVKNVFLLFETYFRERCTAETALNLGTRLFDAYLHRPYIYYLQHNSALMIRDVENSVEAVSRNVFLSIAGVFSESLVILGVLAVLFITQPEVTLAVTGVIAVLGGAFLAFMRNKVLRWGQSRITAVGSVIRAVQQGFGSIKESKILGRENSFVDRYSTARHLRVRTDCLYFTATAAPRLIMESVLVIGLVMAIIFSIAQADSAVDMLPILGLFAYAGFRVVPAFNKILMHLNSIRFGQPAVERVHDGISLACVEDVKERSMTGNETSVARLSFGRDIGLRDVSYHYPGASQNSLSRISLTIEKGSAIGVVGATGAGKSTLTDVMLGLLPPTEGQLLVDGLDVIGDPRPWQRNIGYVPQTIYITDDSILANIAFGVSPPEIDHAAVHNAAKIAKISTFVETLPEKFDTVVGERGIRLSGGQRQRIGIARALYHRPQVLIMDEATSALDNETEREIANALAELHGKVTMIIIAHRLSTVRHCDMLVFMKGGRIADTGTFDDLHARNAEFRRMVELGELTPKTAVNS